jgi:hypothetical protein
VGVADLNGRAARDLCLAGDRLYAALDPGGLCVLDVSDPTNPVVLGTAYTPRFALSVAVTGDVAFVSDQDYGVNAIYVFDVSDPEQLRPIGFLDTPGQCNGLAAYRGYVCAADAEPGGLRILPAQCGAMAGVDETAPGLGLRVVPNPAPGEARILLDARQGGTPAVHVYDAAGRHVRALSDGAAESGPAVLRWDGRATDGSVLPSGVYFVRVASAAGREGARVVLIR